MKFWRGFWRKLTVMMVAVVVAAAAPVSVWALSEEQLYFYAQNGIYFYQSGRTCNNSRTVSGGNLNYAGAQVWSDTEVEAIAANQAIYEEAAGMYDFPWQVMAVLHSMETGLRRYNPDNGQGVYQLYSLVKSGSFYATPAASISEEDFRQQTITAAGFVSNLVGDLNEPDNAKKLFFQYNGTSQKYIEKALALGFSAEEAANGEGSVYVMNRYDERRDPTSDSMSSAWPGRFEGDGKYVEGSTTTVFGAFVKYEAIYGNTNCKAAGGTIAEVALELSWEGHRSHAKNDPKEEYVEAMKQVGAYIRGNGYYPYGASCDQFVGTVMRYSGADADFPVFGPEVQENYMRGKPNMYMQVDVGSGDFSVLEPGDIFVTTNAGRHIYLFVGEIDGQLWQASASADDRTAEHFASVYFTDNGIGRGVRYYNVWRRINYDG